MKYKEILRDNRAFSLAEMLTATAIMSILTAIAVPTFVSMQPGLRLNGASRSVFGKLMWARAQAVEENITYSVVFSGNHTLQIIRDANANGSADTGESTETINIQGDYPDCTLAVTSGEIKELLPESRFIHLLRDCRDVVASLLTASRGWGVSWAPSSAKLAAAMWVQHVDAVKTAAKNLSSREFCEIRYEDLWNSSPEALKKLAEFLDITWSEDAMKVAIENNRAQVMEISGTPIPVFGEIGGRSGRVARLPRGFIGKARPNVWKADLSMHEKYEVWRETRKIMSEAGYFWRLGDWL